MVTCSDDIFLTRSNLHHPDIDGHLLRRYIFNAVISTSFGHQWSLAPTIYFYAVISTSSGRHGTAIFGEARRRKGTEVVVFLRSFSTRTKVIQTPQVTLLIIPSLLRHAEIVCRNTISSRALNTFRLEIRGVQRLGKAGYDDFVPGEVTKTTPSGNETT